MQKEINPKKGIESLTAAVLKDAGEVGICEGECTHKSHRYCDKLKWVFARAEQYAEFTGKTVEEIIAAWEDQRTYWYLNFYQEVNQPDLKDGKIEVISYENWTKELTDKYGDDPKLWKFKCCACGHIQCAQDFIDAGINPDGHVYFSCIGRWKKARGVTVGCDWTLGGLFSMQKRMVISPELKVIPVFETA